MTSKPSRPTPPLWLAPCYGLINGVLLIPVSISFTSIIFSDAFFAPYLPRLVNLVLFSSMLHQCAFTMLSSLPFAVGQVQDSGLIFLSAMAASTVQAMREDDPHVPPISIISTVLVELALSTLLLGVCLVVMGKLQLASVVQYLPVPVIGGYLAFIGFFCGRAGLEMMAGPLPGQWLPGFIVGASMYAMLRRFRSPLVLPVCMFSTLAVFYVLVVLFSGWTLQDARDWGWISPQTRLHPPGQESSLLLDSAGLFRLEAVHWDQLPRQVPCWVGMVLVVAFSSSLDVAAIEMELGLPLDYNRELTTVGYSNVLSGLFGGFTGSYIFSQTIFTMRRGIFSRVCGLFIVLLELAVVLLPVSITAYVPKFFFGSLLILIALDLLLEWLVIARTKMMAAEYAVVLLTFGAIQLVGIEAGLALGVLFASVGFVLSFASIAASVVPTLRSSNVVRTFEERSVLIEHRRKIVTLSLQGYVFYGSAVKILEDVKAHVVLRPTSSTTPSDADFESFDSSTFGDNDDDAVADEEVGSATTEGYGTRVAPSLFVYTPVKQSGSKTDPIAAKSSKGYGSLDDSPVGSPPGSSSGLSIYNLGADDIASLHRRVGDQASLAHGGSLLASVWSSQSDFREAKKTNSVSLQSKETDSDPDTDGTLFQEHHQNEHQQHKTEYLVLDFSSTIGVDATASRTCFLMLSALMRASGVTVVFANCSAQIQNVLAANGVVKQNDVVIPRLDDALEWCEEQILARALRARPGERDRGLARDKSYYASAWQRRHGLPVARSDDPKSELRLESSTIELKELPSTSSSQAQADTSPVRPGVSEADRELAAHARCLRRLLEDHLEISAATNQTVGTLLSTQLLVQFFDRRCVVGGCVVFDIGQASDHVFLLEEGEVELCCVNVSREGSAVERVNKICAGGIFNEAAFFLGATCSLRALALCPCALWTLSRESYSRMETEQPRMCLLLQHLLLKSLSISHVANLYKLAPDTAYSNLFHAQGSGGSWK